MAQISVKNGQEVTAPDTSENEIVFDGNSTFSLSQGQTVLGFVEVTAGTIQFASGDSILPAHKAWASGSKFPMSFRPGVRNLKFKAASNTDKFVVTF